MPSSGTGSTPPKKRTPSPLAELPDSSKALIRAQLQDQANKQLDEEIAERTRKKAAGIDVHAAATAGEHVTPIDYKPAGECLGDLVLRTDNFTEEEFEAAFEATRSHGAQDAVFDEHLMSLIRASPAYMAQELLSGPSEAPYNGRFIVSEHHEEWDDLVVSSDRVCVLAPRDHSKTFFFDFAVPIWKIITQPGGKGFIFSATQPQADRILLDIKTELENNPRLRWLVPAKKDHWRASSIRLSNGHVIYARGFGTKVRGAHPNWIVVDDGLNDETAYSETVRKKEIEYFFTALTNMIVPGGQIIVVGTPFHQMDLYAELEKNKKYTFRRYQALKPDGTALWPERYNKQKLEEKKQEIGTIRFTREFQCEPIGDDMSLFPGHLFRGDPTEQPMVKLGMPAKYWNNLGITRYMGVDFALSSSVQADYTVIWTMGVDRAGNRWIVDIKRAKGLPYQEQRSLIIEAARKYKPALIFLEANQMQRIFGDELIRTTDLPIKKFITGVQKNSLEVGVPSLRVLLENKKFRIPRGDERSVEETNIWINEMRSFTWSDGKLQGVGGHDDTVMACWICDQAIKQGGFSVSFGDEKMDPLEQAELDDYMGMSDPKKKGASEDEEEGEDEELDDFGL